MCKSRFHKKLLVLSLSALIPCSAIAAGGSPKGKPFVEIQGQIVEVQGDISGLEAQLADALSRIESLEEKVTVIENHIVELEAKDTALETQIQDVVAQATANNTDIALLFQSVADINTQIELLRTDVDANGNLSQENADAIVALEAEIAVARDEIAQNVSGISSLLSQQQTIVEAIEDMEEQILILQAQLAAKQDLVDGTCLGNSAIQSIEPDGSVVCTNTNEAEIVSYSSVYSQQTKYTNGRTWTNHRHCDFFGLNCWYHRHDGPLVTTVHTFYCPSGHARTGAALVSSGGLRINYQRAYGNNAWQVSTTNETINRRGVRVHLDCLRVNVN